MDVCYNRWFLDPLFRGQYSELLFTDLAVASPPLQEEDMAQIATPLDFVGINYYFRLLLRARRGNPQQARKPAYEPVVPVPGASYTVMAWEIYPQGLGDCLLRVHREYAPRLILVMENGAAFADQWNGRSFVCDERRVHYLREHIDMLEQTRRQGVPVEGYFVWPLLDNYEWIDGYSKRFGIVYVDFATQRRQIKESGRWYAAFIQAQRQGYAVSR